MSLEPSRYIYILYSLVKLQQRPFYSNTTTLRSLAAKLALTVAELRQVSLTADWTAKGYNRGGRLPPRLPFRTLNNIFGGILGNGFWSMFEQKVPHYIYVLLELGLHRVNGRMSLFWPAWSRRNVVTSVWEKVIFKVKCISMLIYSIFHPKGASIFSAPPFLKILIH